MKAVARWYLPDSMSRTTPMRDGLPVLIFGNALYFEYVKASSAGLIVLWCGSGKHHRCRRGMGKDRGGLRSSKANDITRHE
jgi:hypothetical protein